MSVYEDGARTTGFPWISAISKFFKEHIREQGMLIALVVNTVFFQIMTNGTLLQPLNITNLILQNSYIVVMALGMLLVIVAGHIDLSVGSVAGFIGAVAAVMMVQMELSPIIAVTACLIIGAVIGAVQGFWVAYMKMPAFIVTLAGMLVFRGLTLVLLQGQSIGPFPVEFQRLSSGFIPDFGVPGDLHITTLIIGVLLAGAIVYLDVRDRNNQRKFNVAVTPLPIYIIRNVLVVGAIMGLCYLLASYNGIPNVLIALFVLIGLYTFITKRSVIGRRIYALGGNVRAARLSGVNTERLTFYTFINMGVLAALAGMIFAARLNAATPKAGTGFELDVIAAAFIGGASASGGVGTVIGAVIGAFVMGVMNNGMSIIGIGIDWQQAIKGLVLLFAVFFDVLNKKKG